jgi:hypothetical protein
LIWHAGYQMCMRERETRGRLAGFGFDTGEGVGDTKEAGGGLL